MAKYSNTEIREAVAEYYRLGSLRKASAKLGIPKSTIALWISKIGTTRFDGRKGCPHPNRKKLKQESISPIVEKMYGDTPYLTATELHLQIVHTMGIDCSYATVLRAKSNLGLSRKRVAGRSPAVAEGHTPKIWTTTTSRTRRGRWGTLRARGTSRGRRCGPASRRAAGPRDRPRQGVRGDGAGDPRTEAIAGMTTRRC